MDYALGVEALRTHCEEFLKGGGALRNSMAAATAALNEQRAKLRNASARGTAGGSVHNLARKQSISLRHAVVRQRREEIQKDLSSLLGASEFPMFMEQGGTFHVVDDKMIDGSGTTADLHEEAAKKASQRVRHKVTAERQKAQRENALLDALLDARKEQLVEIDRLQRQRRIVERRRASSALGLAAAAAYGKVRPGSRLPPPALVVPATLMDSVPLLPMM
jgi:hypothetical protein